MLQCMHSYLYCASHILCCMLWNAERNRNVGAPCRNIHCEKKTEAMLCFFFSYFTLLTDITKDPNSVLHHTHSFQLWFHTLYTLWIFHNYDAYVLDLLLFALALVLVSPFRRVFSFLNGLYAVFIHFRSIWWCNEEESTMRATLLCVLFNKKVPFLRI